MKKVLFSLLLSLLLAMPGVKAQDLTSSEVADIFVDTFNRPEFVNEMLETGYKSFKCYADNNKVILEMVFKDNLTMDGFSNEDKNDLASTISDSFIGGMLEGDPVEAAETIDFMLEYNIIFKFIIRDRLGNKITKTIYPENLKEWAR